MFDRWYFGRGALLAGAMLFTIADNTENNILKLVFNATAWANMADNAATGPIPYLYNALHTADPTDTGTQNSSEVTYTGYVRQNTPRTTGGWTASSAGSTSPVANIDFAAGTGGSGTVQFWSIGLPKVSGAAGSISCTSASPGVFTWTGHGLANNMQFSFSGTPPTGLTAGTIYYVKNVAANTFEVAATPGGTSINTTGTGSAMIGYGGGTATDILWSGTVTPNIVTGNGVTPRLTTASTITLD